MHPIITEMLAPYDCRTPADYKHALKEIVQQIALLGLSRQGFFNHVAFYGGTALRIGHGLRRFSEDMDFTLLAPDPQFSLGKYLKGIEEELAAFELECSSQSISKRTISPIESAFIKGNALAILMSITDRNISSSGTHRNELLKVKLEIDTDPPYPSGESETKMLFIPIPFSYRILSLESLFSGKLHAIICRSYPSGRVKGRDYYDLIWYVQHKVSPDIPYLEAKLKQSGNLGADQNLTLDMVKQMLTEKLETIDIDAARKDVSSFIKDDFELALWSVDFFKDLIREI